MKELDELITYIENDLIGKHKDIEIIDEAIKKYAELYHKKQLELYGVSNLFASGKKVQIIDCLHGHKFGIGEIVTLKNKQGNQWLARGFDGNEWYIDEDEANCC